ncbi:MAG: hypothetical protein NWQ31_03090, partial [Polaribacter sp.]|nr:hypothetical protein [Polaribacter sp.]
WERIVDENDVQSYALCIIEDPENANLLFLGTDDGLYISINAGEKWTKWTESFPTVPVKDLVIHPRENDLIIGTFGRAAWVLDDIRPLRAIANGNVLSKKLQVFTPPTAYDAASQQPTGSRFGADAMYQGENRKTGAIISYYINIPQIDKKEEKSADENVENSDENSDKTENTVKNDSIKLEIFDGERLIRTLKFKTPKESGIHKTTWYLREKGVDRASRSSRESKNEPRGVAVKPGTYHLKMTLGDAISEQDIKVAFDPRLQISEEAINQKYNASKELEGYQEKMAAIVKQLVESKNTAEAIKNQLTKDNKTKYKEELKSSKEIIKKIDNLIDVFLGKIDKRQGITRNKEVTVNERFGTASWYVSSRFGAQTATETQLVNQFKEAFTKAVTNTNSFFNSDWLTYKSSVEKIQISQFKETKIYPTN